ncbi:MAG: GDP-mannose 4,6-dehydratase [Proteobacteria bacterium]|nr:GDP-mannose 4,6-dehydratase [Pseudomonadota bacterium]
MPKTETILVTGGAGFIGSNLCHFLIDKAFNVVCLDNFDDFYSEEIKRNNVKNLLNNQLFEFIKGDIRDSVLLDNVFSKHQIDFVIHLAAKAGVRNSIFNTQEYFDVNVNGSICLLETMRKHNVKNLVFSSSSSVYGNKNGKLLETENCDNPISPYAVSKRAVEMLNYNYHINSNFNVVNLRLFSVYGKNQRPDLVLYKFINLISNNQPIEIYGNADTTRDYTYIDDIVNAFISSIEFLKTSDSNVYEIINIGNDNPISLQQLIDLITKTTKRNDIKIVETKFVKGEVTNTHADIDKARRLLNYKPNITIDYGIKQFYEWFEKNGIKGVKNSIDKTA